MECSNLLKFVNIHEPKWTGSDALWKMMKQLQKGVYCRFQICFVCIFSPAFWTRSSVQLFALSSAFTFFQESLWFPFTPQYFTTLQRPYDNRRLQLIISQKIFCATWNLIRFQFIPIYFQSNYFNWKPNLNINFL